MNFVKKILKQESNRGDSTERIKITKDNLDLWIKFEKLFNEGEVKFDSKGRLRYLHGAPVGEMILIGTNKDENPVYKESAENGLTLKVKKLKILFGHNFLKHQINH